MEHPKPISYRRVLLLVSALALIVGFLTMGIFGPAKAAGLGPVSPPPSVLFGQPNTFTQRQIMPATVLRVYLAVNQSVTDATNAYIKYDTVDIDSLSAYSTGTGLYTPTIAGKYLVCATARGTVTTALTSLNMFISKNATGSPPVATSGAPRAIVGPLSAGSPQISQEASGCVIFSMNGTSDTISVVGTVTGTGGGDLFDGASFPYNTLTVVFLGS